MQVSSVTSQANSKPLSMLDLIVLQGLKLAQACASVDTHGLRLALHSLVNDAAASLKLTLLQR